MKSNRALPSRPSPDASNRPDGNRPSRNRSGHNHLGHNRRGSILIFVIGALVLLAIIATAFLITSRDDRYATQQNSYNTQIDLLVEGVLKAARINVTADESVPGTAANAKFEKFDAFTFQTNNVLLNTLTPTQDQWLASRVPVTADRFSNFDPNNPPLWPAVTGPVIGNEFETPLRPATPAGIQYAGSLRYVQRENLLPSTVTVNGVNYPAFRIDTFTLPAANTVLATRYMNFLAGDADGDGIADAPLLKLPVGELAGLSYYAAVRIIDNSSALNVNTALARDLDFAGNGNAFATTNALQPGMFKGGVGLAEMLWSYQPNATAPAFDNLGVEFNRLNGLRALNNLSSTSTRFDGVTNTSTNVSPIDDVLYVPTPGQRPDFAYASIGDALQATLGNRSGNTGYPVWPPTQRAKSSFSDSLNLASRFAIADSSGQVSPLEQAVGESVRQVHVPALALLRTQPYADTGAYSGISLWFGQHFDYRGEGIAFPPDTSNFMNRRTILTAANATSTTAPPQPTAIFPPLAYYNAVNAAGAPTYTPVASVLPQRRRALYTDTGTDAGIVQFPMAYLPTAVGEPVIDAKVSVNTARFAEMNFGFFRVMAQHGFTERLTAATARVGVADNFETGTPFTTFETNATTGPLAINDTFWGKANAVRPATPQADPYYADPYVGTKFIAGTFAKALEPAGQASIANGQTANEPEQHPLRMFRSPLRAPHDRAALPGTVLWNLNTPRLPADQVLLLRSAIAAANAEALRDNDDRITPHDIPLIARVGNTETAVRARVYGLERQPYLTEVYVNTDNVYLTPVGPNPAGYVAIKFYNPYPFPIDLQNCRLVGLRRSWNNTGPAPLNPAITPATQYPNMQVLDLAVLGASGSEAVTGLTVDQLALNTAVTNVAGTPTYGPTIVPPNGTLVLENLPATPLTVPLADDAKHRPVSAGFGAGPAQSAPITPTMPATQNYAYMPGLTRVVYDRELVLVRPLGATRVNPADLTIPLTYVSDRPTIPDSIARFAPLDSYDFTGLQVPVAGALPLTTRAQAWHYARYTDQWKFVYPGRYDANQSVVVIAGDPPRPRQSGTAEAVNSDPVDPLGITARGWVPGTNGGDPWYATPPVPAVTLNLIPSIGRFVEQFPIQLNSVDWPGINPLIDYGSGARNQFPYGGFSRLGDFLQVPFIGSYTLQIESTANPGAHTTGAVTTILEMNAVTTDAVFAEDTDPYDDPNANGTLDVNQPQRSREQIGRFAPLRPSHGSITGAKQPGDPADLGRVADPAGGPDFFTAEGNNAWVNDVHRYSDEWTDAARIVGRGDTPSNGAPTSDNQRRLNRYVWAKSLFDVFGIDAPHDDYLANYPTQPKWQRATQYYAGDVVQFGKNVYVALAAHVSNVNDPPPVGEISEANADTPTWRCLPRGPLSNNGGSVGSRSDLIAGGRSDEYNTANDKNEAAVGVQGLVNINTAPERVLAALPWVPAGDKLQFNFNVYPPNVTSGTDGEIDNAQIARAIVQYRDGNYYPVGGALRFARALRPFTSPFDLYDVPVIRAAQNVILATADPQAADGDVSPAAGIADGVRFDFEEQFLLMNRVSNLISVRSDTYTIYVLVQGWRNAGTTSPELVVQRRAAILIDRSEMRDQQGTPSSAKVYAQ